MPLCKYCLGSVSSVSIESGVSSVSSVSSESRVNSISRISGGNKVRRISDGSSISSESSSCGSVISTSDGILLNILTAR